jgi:hypothetical protein
MPNNEKLIEVRCTNAKCRKLFFKADIKEGKIEVKCKCGTTTVLEIKKPDRQPVMQH